MSTRHLRARLDRLEQRVKMLQANGTLPFGPAPSDGPEDPYRSRIQDLVFGRIFGELTPEETSELERWEAQHPPEPDDPDDPLDLDLSCFEEALRKAASDQGPR
jgi:hypothetical protein